MTDAVPAAAPRGVSRPVADPGASQVQPDSPQNLLGRLFGAEQPDRAQLEAFQKAFPGVDPRRPDAAQRIMQHLQQLGLQLGNPPSIGSAREGMIAAIAAANPGESREALEKKSLTELMGMYRALQPQQQTAGAMQASPGSPDAGTPGEGVERPAGRRGGTRRAANARRTARGAHPPRPRTTQRRQHTQPAGTRTVQRREPVDRREPVARPPAGDPVVTRANAELTRLHGSPEGAALRRGEATPEQRERLISGYAAVVRSLGPTRHDQGMDTVPESIRGLVRDRLNPPTP